LPATWEVKYDGDGKTEKEARNKVNVFFSLSHQLFYKNYLPGGAADEFVVGLWCIFVGKRPFNNV
jgi:hypothetical protein